MREIDQQNAPAKKLNIWMVSTFILLGIVIGFGISQMPYFNEADTKTSTVTGGENVQMEPDSKKPEVQKFSDEETAKLSDSNSVKGDSSAAVSFVEFSDFQSRFP